MDGTLVIYIFLLVRALSKKNNQNFEKRVPDKSDKKNVLEIAKAVFLDKLTMNI